MELQTFDLTVISLPFGLLFPPHAVPIPKQCVKLKIINLCQSGYSGLSLWEYKSHPHDVYTETLG